MRKLIVLFLFLGVLLYAPNAWCPIGGPPGIAIEEEDKSPRFRTQKIKVSNATLTKNSDGSASIAIGAGGGDSVTVNSTAADTTANLLDGTIDFSLADGGAGGPDNITATLDPTAISGKTEVTSADTDYLLVWDATDSVLKKVDMGEVRGGGAEVNNLETVCTDIATTEIFVGNAANAGVYTALSGDVTMDNVGAVTVVDDSHNHVITNIDSFTKANLETQTSDVADFAEADGDTWTGVHDYGGATSLEIPNAAAPTTDAAGEIALDTTITDHQPLLQYYDGGENMTVIAIDTAELPALDNEIVKYDAGTDKFVLEADAGGGGTAFTEVNLSIISAKLTGTFVTNGDSTQGAQIDAGDGNWRLLFDATTDEGAVWQFRMPANYASGPILKVGFSMTSGEANEVQFEAAVMAYTPTTDTADIGTASFDTVNEGTATTVSATAGEVYEQSITLTNADSVAAGDTVFIQLSTDADDATSDDATGDREIVYVTLIYTGS